MSERIFEYRVMVRAEKWEHAHRLMAILKSTVADGFDDLNLPTVIETVFVDSHESEEMN